jgi:pectate lyase
MKKIGLAGLVLLLMVSVYAESYLDQYENKVESWFAGPEAKQVAETFLTWQSPAGSWPKNVDTTRKPYTGDPNALKGTFDNGATVGEMRFLARIFKATGNERYKQAFLRGFAHILEAQYPSGGWPQYYPLSKQYHRYITFNDDTMVHLMVFMRDAASLPLYDFLDARNRNAAQQAFDRGIDCILKCQIRVNGKLTVWCAQHDAVDFSPRPARSYELVSLSGSESASILRLLMTLDNPGPEVIDAVMAGAQWYEASVIHGIRITKSGGNRIAVEDPQAEPLWARFYEIETNRPFFADRDGVKYYNFNDLSTDRRNGYSWYGGWGRTVANDYKKWQKKWADRIAARNVK